MSRPMVAFPRACAVSPTRRSSRTSTITGNQVSSSPAHVPDSRTWVVRQPPQAIDPSIDYHRRERPVLTEDSAYRPNDRQQHLQQHQH